ncbi:retinitis pigmentosa 1-like 1 protein isoform X3 [Notechis scutatus]|uniref:Retinitis pigmentosa 1-like 1 protein isoform X3 n=1 Tax=Notechis scutatus TaxID=8663 RepID=A0A6J1V5K0_9SAUR|nr:retinitis pigmentosa 1-like 1 protein isoform X3 [Notechis scutatus]
MEPEEGHKEDQAGSAGNEGLNQASTVGENNREVNEGTAPFFSEATEFEDQGREIFGVEGELNPERVDVSEGEAISGEDRNYTEAEPEEVKTGEKSSLENLKSNAEYEELGGAGQKETDLFVSPSAGEAEEKTPKRIDQRKIKKHEETGIVEDRILEMDEKVDLENRDQREKDVHADTEGKADYPANLNDKSIKQTADREGMALDQKDLEGGIEKEIAETTEIQKEHAFSSLDQGGNLKITEAGKDVAADATSVHQRQTEESVGLGMEQNKVYTKAEDEKIAGVEQSLIAHEAVTLVETQEKPEEPFENLGEPGKRDATMAEEEARLLETNQVHVEEAEKAPEAEIGTEKKDAATTLHQTKAEKVVEGSQGESGQLLGDQKVTVVEAGVAETEGVVIIPVEDKTEDLVETSEVVMGEKDFTAVEAESGTIGKVTAEDDVSLVVEVKDENLVDISETQMGEELIKEKDLAEVTVTETEKDVGEVTETESLRIKKEMPQIEMEEIPIHIQDKRGEEKTESEMIEEKVEDLTQPEQKPKEQVEREGEQLASAGMIDKGETGELEMALAINQNEIMKSLRPSQEKAEIAVIDAVGEKLPFQEKILAWSPELERPTQEIAGVGSREGISRSYRQEGKLSRELISELVRIGQERRNFGLGQVELLETSIKLTEDLDKLGSEEQSHKVKGKIIIGLAGLRQGSIQVTPHRTVRSAGGYDGVLAHVAPGLIVTGLRKPEGKRLTKQDHMQLDKRTLEQRETRSAEQGRFGVSMRSNEAVVFMGYRIGRERMSCLSEAEKRMVKIQLPELEEIGKKPAIEQVEVPRQEQEVRKEEIQEINANEVVWHQLEQVPTAWLGRPLTRDYMAAQSSGWTAGIGPGHGRISRSLRADV